MAVEVCTTPLHAYIQSHQAPATEPSMIDTALDKVNEMVASMLGSLPDLTSIDLSMEKSTKSKGL